MNKLSTKNNFMKAIIDLIEKKTSTKKSLICTVLTSPPNITLKYEDITIPTKQIYVANYLLENYHRQYKIDGIIDNIDINVTSYDFNNNTSSQAVPNHPAHPIPTLSGSGHFNGSGTYKSHKDFWLTDTLIPGNEVLVELVNNSYIVVAQIVRMPNKAKEGA